VDAKGLIVGRLASNISHLLQGKHKPFWRPDKDVGDYVVIKNCEDIVFTGQKWQQKVYRRHSGYPGHLKETPVKELLMNHPEKIIEKAVFGMLPKNKLRWERIKRLKIYPHDSPPHQGQMVHSVLPLHIQEIWDDCKWQETLLDPMKNEGYFIKFKIDGPDYLITKEPGPGTIPYRFKRNIKPGKKWLRPAPDLKSKRIPLTFKQILKKANPKGETMEKFEGLEKMLSKDEPEEDPPEHDLFIDYDSRGTITIKPPVYPKQKNLHNKFRRRWLQKQEAAQRHLEKNSTMFKG